MTNYKKQIGKRIDTGESVYGCYSYEFERNYISQGYDDVPPRCSYITNKSGTFEIQNKLDNLKTTKND